VLYPSSGREKKKLLEKGEKKIREREIAIPVKMGGEEKKSRPGTIYRAEKAKPPAGGEDSPNSF